MFADYKAITYCDCKICTINFDIYLRLFGQRGQTVEVGQERKHNFVMIYTR